MSNFRALASRAYSLTLNKQFVFFAGIGLMVILLVFSINWVRSPNYSPLFTSLSSQDEKNVIKLLDVNGISYQLSPSSGMIMVSGGKLNKARMIMAQNGLPSRTQNSYDLLMKGQGIYTSQANEDMIKKRILEENIQTAIETINGIQAAKVQLALPHHTDFMQKIIHPKASVVLRLSPGTTLTASQIKGISYLVSSSIPYMKASEVTIVDQTGELLSSSDSSPFALSSDQLKYKQEIDDKLSQQIINVLAPIVGRDNLRVQVNSNLDFNLKENTTKRYMPNKNSIQSEQIDKRIEGNSFGGAQGVPGSLSNQPPRSGKLNERPVGSGGGSSLSSDNGQGSSHDRETYNYSLGEAVTHTQYAKGEIQNLSVAILLNDVKRKVEQADIKNAEKKKIENVAEKYEPLKPDEIKKLTELAKSAVGFEAMRGDKISVINEKFIATDKAEEIKPFTIPFYQQEWFLEIIKSFMFLGGFVIFAIYIWKPFFNYLFNEEKDFSMDFSAETVSIRGGNINAKIEKPLPNENEVENHLSQVKKVFQNSPDVAAGVIKKWVRSAEI